MVENCKNPNLKGRLFLVRVRLLPGVQLLNSNKCSTLKVHHHLSIALVPNPVVITRKMLSSNGRKTEGKVVGEGELFAGPIDSISPTG